MKINVQMEEVLKIISKRLTDKNINWVLGGSLNLAIQGVNVIPHDIDILTNQKGALAIQKELDEFTQESVVYKESDLFKSWLGVFEINGVKVEIMGDLSSRASIHDNWRPPTKLKNPVYITYQDLTIPVKSLKEEYGAYTRMGRTEKAEKIKSCLKGLSFEA